MGKSRLALEAVRSFESEVRDGGWLVDLARAGGATDVVRVVAQALDARGGDALARAIGRLRDADAILILDSCEHVIEEAGRVASALLRECPGVRVLATSREALHLVGETRLRVAPLAVPDPESADRDQSAAVQLFAARARAARPGFELTAEAAPIVAEISRQIDGLPLAIELAAARVNHLGLTELLSLVARRLGRVRDPRASDGARAGLRTLVEWSYGLVHADEKMLLHQLAVHRGGASLPSLICLGAGHGLDETTVTYLLGILVDKSIVSVSFPGGHARYDLLDSVRDYVLEQLTATGSLAATQRAHAEYFATLADAARRELRASDWQAGLRQLVLENDNLWAALTYAREAPDPPIAIRLGAALGWYFAVADVSRRDGASSNLRLRPRRRTRRSPSEPSCLGASASLRPKSSIWTRQSTPVKEALRSRAARPRPRNRSSRRRRCRSPWPTRMIRHARPCWPRSMRGRPRRRNRLGYRPRQSPPSYRGRTGRGSLDGRGHGGQVYDRSDAIGFIAFQAPARLPNVGADRMGDAEARGKRTDALWSSRPRPGSVTTRRWPWPASARCSGH